MPGRGHAAYGRSELPLPAESGLVAALDSNLSFVPGLQGTQPPFLLDGGCWSDPFGVASNLALPDPAAASEDDDEDLGDGGSSSGKLAQRGSHHLEPVELRD